jgi:hypothetical protein
VADLKARFCETAQADHAFCTTVFYPEFANEDYRHKSARQPGLPRPSHYIRRGKIAEKIHKQSQFSAVTITK